MQGLKYCLARRGKSHALNLAMAEAKGSVLAFTDDDCTVGKDWIARGAKALTSGRDVALVFGSLDAAPHDPASVMIPVLSVPEREVQRGSSDAILCAGAGANMFAKKEVLERIGGFDERFGPGAGLKSCEEFDLYYRSLLAGNSVVRDPDIRVLHWGARTISDGSAEKLIREYLYGEGAVLGKHCRKRDRRAYKLSAGTLARGVYWSALNLAKRKPSEASRMLYWLNGFFAGYHLGA